MVIGEALVFAIVATKDSLHEYAGLVETAAVAGFGSAVTVTVAVLVAVVVAVGEVAVLLPQAGISRARAGTAASKRLLDRFMSFFSSPNNGLDLPAESAKPA